MNTILKTVGHFLKGSTLSNKETEATELIERTIKVARTKSGAPCLWESYSEFDNGLIRSTVITDSEGNIKNAVYIKNAKNKQALVPIHPGDVIVKAFKDNIGIAVSLLEVKEISSFKNEAQIIPIFRKPSDTDKPFPVSFTEAIQEVYQKLEDSEKICSTLLDKK